MGEFDHFFLRAISHARMVIPSYYIYINIPGPMWRYIVQRLARSFGTNRQTDSHTSCYFYIYISIIYLSIQSSYPRSIDNAGIPHRNAQWTKKVILLVFWTPNGFRGYYFNPVLWIRIRIFWVQGSGSWGIHLWKNLPKFI